MIDAISAVFLVQMDDRFRVAPAAIAVTAGLEVVAQVLVVIDFAVEDDPNGFVLITDGLVSGLDVDNAKPANIASPCGHSCR